MDTHVQQVTWLAALPVLAPLMQALQFRPLQHCVMYTCFLHKATMAEPLESRRQMRMQHAVLAHNTSPAAAAWLGCSRPAYAAHKHTLHMQLLVLQRQSSSRQLL